MRAVVAMAVVLVGAGGCQPATSTQGEGMRNLDIVHDQEARVRLCTAIAQLHAAHCAPFDAVEDAKLDDCSVVDGVYLSGYGACASGSDCGAVQACIASADAGSGGPYVARCARAATPRRRRSPRASRPARSRTAYDGGSTRLGDMKTGLEKPVEVCGGPAEVSFLMRVTCFDGSHAFADRAAASAARQPAGNGGRCGRIVDHVAAKCPERTYDVFVDPYRCPGH